MVVADAWYSILKARAGRIPRRLISRPHRTTRGAPSHRISLGSSSPRRPHLPPSIHWESCTHRIAKVLGCVTCTAQGEPRDTRALPVATESGTQQRSGLSTANSSRNRGNRVKNYGTTAHCWIPSMIRRLAHNSARHVATCRGGVLLARSTRSTSNSANNSNSSAVGTPTSSKSTSSKASGTTAPGTSTTSTTRSIFDMIDEQPLSTHAIPTELRLISVAGGRAYYTMSTENGARSIPRDMSRLGRSDDADGVSQAYPLVKDDGVSGSTEGSTSETRKLRSVGCGQDAFFRRWNAIGVADGVGGWSNVPKGRCASVKCSRCHTYYKLCLLCYDSRSCTLLIVTPALCKW